MSARHPSELALERHLLDPARSSCAAHLASCPRCQARLAEMRGEGDEFAKFVYPATVERIEEAASGRGRRWMEILAPITALAAAAAVFLLVRPAGLSDEERVEQAVREGRAYGVKGGGPGIGLGVFVGAPAGARLARDGEEVPAGTAIRFRVQPSRACHLWILSADASGQVSRLFPPVGEGEGGARVEGAYEVPGGAILDARGGLERIFAVCAPRPTPWAAVERVARSLGRGTLVLRSARALPGLPDDTAQASLLLEVRP